MPTSDPSRPGWWQCRAVRPDGSPAWFAVVWSADHPDGTRLDLPEEEARPFRERAVCVATYDEGVVRRLEVTPVGAPKAPPLWLLEIDEADATPPARHLVAFSGHDVAPGSLLDAAAVGGVAVSGEDQLGAIRWYPATGEVDQVYVAPHRRRHGVASALIAAGTTLSLARGWPRFWGDGQRTALGERLRNASPWAHRAADLTHLAPPMTPGDEA